MKLRPSISDRIEAAFAAAVASGDYEAAEGWLATARYVADRQRNRKPERLSRAARAAAGR